MSERTILSSEEAGRLVKQRRTERGITLRDAAAEIGMDASTLSRCENFKHELDAENLGKIAKWLGVPLDRFPDGDESQKFVYLDGEPLTQVVDVLIHRDPFLSPDAKRSLSAIFANAYRPLAHTEGAAQ